MTIKELNEQIEKLKGERYALAKEKFAQGVEELFAKYPSVKWFSWRQYTPYFNDGDTCYFSVHNYPDFDYQLPDDEFPTEVRYEDVNTDFEKAFFDEASDFIGSFDDDDLLKMFGDHVEVIVSREGITTEDYDHE